MLPLGAAICHPAALKFNADEAPERIRSLPLYPAELRAHALRFAKLARFSVDCQRPSVRKLRPTARTREDQGPSRTAGGPTTCHAQVEQTPPEATREACACLPSSRFSSPARQRPKPESPRTHARPQAAGVGHLCSVSRGRGREAAPRPDQSDHVRQEVRRQADPYRKDGRG
jgi:hypothetical protein